MPKKQKPPKAVRQAIRAGKQATRQAKKIVKHKQPSVGAAISHAGKPLPKHPLGTVPKPPKPTKAPRTPRQRQQARQTKALNVAAPVQRATGIGPKRQQALAAQEKLGVTYKPPKDPIATELGKLAPTGIKIVRALTGDQPGATSPTAGEIANVALTLAPGIGAAAKVTKTLEDVAHATRAVKAEQAATQAERATRAAQDATKAARVERRAAQATRATKAEKGVQRVKKAAQTTGVRAANVTQKAAKRVIRPAKTATYAVTHPRYALNALPLAAKGKAGALVTSGTLASEPVVSAFTSGAQREAKGFAEAPGKTLGTTLRTAEGVPAALVGIGQAGVESATTGSLAPLKGVLDQQEAYYKQYSRLIGGSEEQAKRIVQSRLGLIPAITTGLTAGALAKAGGRLGRVHTATESVKAPVRKALSPRATSKLVKQAEHGKTAAEREAARRALEAGAPKEPLRGKLGRKRREAQRIASGHQQQSGQLHREVRGAGKRRLTSLGMKETQGQLLGRLDKTPVTKDVTQGSIVRFLGAHGYHAGTNDLIGTLQRDLSALQDSKREIPADAPHTRKVVEALIAHPEVIGDPNVVAYLRREAEIKTGRSIEHHELATGKPETTPHPGHIRGKYATQATSEGVLLPNEEIPHELRGKTNIRPRPGQTAEKAIRSEAKTRLRAARRMDVQAEALRKQGHVTAAETLSTKAAATHAAAHSNLAIVDRFKTAEKLDRQAVAIELGKSEGDSAALRKQAYDLRKQGTAAQDRLYAEFMNRMEAVRRERGLKEPIYFPQHDVTAIRGPGSGKAYGSAVKRAKFRTGTLERQGRVDEGAVGLVNSMVEGRAHLALANVEASFLREVPFTHNGQIFFTDAEEAALRRQGAIPQQFNRSMRVQTLSGTIHRVDALRESYQEAQRRAAVGQGPRDLHIIAPDSAIREFNAQQEAVGGTLKIARGIARVQGGAMLGTSATWLAFQIPASPLAILAHHWSPARYMRSAEAMYRIYRKAPARERSAFENHYGANSGNLLELGDAHLSRDVLKELKYAQNLASHSSASQTLRAIASHIRRGGPITATVRAYERHIRNFAALMEIDRHSGITPSGKTQLSAQGVKFLESLAQSHESIYSLFDTLKGHPAEKWPEILAHDSKALRTVEQGVYNMLGDFSSLAKWERGLAALTIFYPFVRYSLRFLLYALPKEHPVKAAILYNLAQSNDVELQKLLGGRPDLLQSFGTIVTHGPSGEPGASGISLVRSSPGGNAVIEALGTGKLDLATVLKPATPWLSIPTLALAGQTGFGTSTDVPPLALAARGLVSLSPLTRSLATKIGPEPGFISKLFRAINQSPATVLGQETPRITVDIARQRDAVKAQQLYNFVSDPSTPKSSSDVSGLPVGQQAAAQKLYLRYKASWDQLHALAQKYGAETAAESQRSKAQFEKRHSAYTSKYGIFGTETPGQSTGGSTLGSWGVGGGGGSSGGNYGSWFK